MLLNKQTETPEISSELMSFIQNNILRCRLMLVLNLPNENE